MIFSIEDRIFKLFPGLGLGILVCRVDNTKYGEDILEPALDKVRLAFRIEQPQDHPRVSAWRRAFDTLGAPEGTYHNSIESLVNKALKGGVFPRVNPLVDLYTAVSLEFLVPVVAHDLSRLDGSITLGFAGGNERFTPIEGGEEIVDRGEVVYRDDRSALTRRWIWRQSSKAKVTAETTSAFIPIDVMDGLSLTLADETMDRIRGYLEGSGIGEVVYRDILTRHKPAAEFNV